MMDDTLRERPARRPLQGLFFTGTDTGVGKTFVVAEVARLLGAQGRRVRVCKPVATGAQWRGRWVSDDTCRLAQAAGVGEDELEKITPWAFPEPVAPSVAAPRHGLPLSLHDLAGAIGAQGRDRPVLVEGVGGLLCPLTAEATVADLVQVVALPLIIVTRRALGTLNHTLLTLQAAETRGLAVAGIVVNETEAPRSLAEETNVDELRRWVTVPILAVVPHQDGRSPERRSPIASVDWWGLCSTGSESAEPSVRYQQNESDLGPVA
jgi:dethiobiotin synthetase